MSIYESEAEIAKTANMIRDVMKCMCVSRMPSRSEIELHTKSTSLVNRICRSGGFLKWASILGLETKDCETKHGMKYENMCASFLESMGYETQLTSVKFPYDILVNSKVKVDVKASSGYNYNTGFYYSFNLESKKPRCDFFVFYCVPDKVEKILVVPSFVLSGMLQLSVGVNSIYDKYKDNWGLIKKQVDFLEKLAC